jgi:hypothetical protein
VQGNLLQEEDIKVVLYPLLDIKTQVSSEAPANVVSGEPQQAANTSSCRNPALPPSLSSLPAGRHLSCGLPPPHHC